MRKAGVIIGGILCFKCLVPAQELTMEEYAGQLESLRERDEIALLKIAQLKSEKAQLKDQIAAVKDSGLAVWKNILQAAEINQNEYDEAMKRITSLQQKAAAVEEFSVSERAELAGEISDLKGSKAAMIPRVEGLIFGLEHALATSDLDGRDEIPRVAEPLVDSPEETSEAEKKKPENPQGAASIQRARPLMDSTVAYRVRPGDTLHKISLKIAKPGEAYGWKVLYELNASEIENPNYIYAGQILKIPD